MFTKTLHTSFFAGSYAFTSWACASAINPLAGAIIGASVYASKEVLDCAREKHPLLHVKDACALYAIYFFGGSAVGTFTARALGYPILWKATLILSAQTLGVVILGSISLLGVVFCILALTEGIASAKDKIANCSHTLHQEEYKVDQDF